MKILKYVIHYVCMLIASSRVWFFGTPWTVAHQAPLSMEFSRQESSHFLLQGIFLTQGSNLGLLYCRQFLTSWITRKAQDAMVWGKTNKQTNKQKKPQKKQPFGQSSVYRHTTWPLKKRRLGSNLLHRQKSSYKVIFLYHWFNQIKKKIIQTILVLKCIFFNE